jgi:hypothetical protein
MHGPALPRMRYTPPLPRVSAARVRPGPCPGQPLPHPRKKKSRAAQVRREIFNFANLNPDQPTQVSGSERTLTQPFAPKWPADG